MTKEKKKSFVCIFFLIIDLPLKKKINLVIWESLDGEIFFFEECTRTIQVKFAIKNLKNFTAYFT